jgi:anti-sigma factor RsiW
MTDKSEQTEPISEEQLVAYLDGELDDRTTKRIQQSLETDPDLRHRLESLSGAWAMLDQLEQPQAKTDLAESTLEMVAVAAQDEIEKSSAIRPVKRLGRYGAVALGLLATIFIGFICVSLLKPDPNRQLLEDLTVVQRLDEYRQVDSIEFLRELRKSELFSEDQPDE